MVRRRFTVNSLGLVSFFAILGFIMFSCVARAHAQGAARDRFVVTPFVNQSGQRSLDFLQAGLPVLLGERLARHPRLRFAGPSSYVEKVKIDEALARASAAGTRWVVAGHYERRPDWKVQVSVELYVPASDGGGGPAAPVAKAEAVGSRDDVAHVALTAAIDAFTAAGLPVDGATRAGLTARFGRDPYAFVLFGRGVAQFTGIGVAPHVVGHGNPRRVPKPSREGAPAGDPPTPHAIGGEPALKTLTRALVIDPNVAETRHYLGILHLAAGRPGHARAMWSSALELRPDYLAALSGLAALDRTAGSAVASERYARVLELDPDDVDARRAHGELLSEAGLVEEAQSELERVVAVAPSDLRARRALALVLASRHAGAELAAELTEIVRLDPEDLDARLELGAALTSIGKVDAAIAVYEEVLRRRPKHAAVLKLTGDLYRAKGDGAKAAALYERLHRVAPDDPRPVFLLGSAYYLAGRLDAAERMFTDAARYPGMLGDAYSNLGAIAVRRGQVKEALWFLSRAAQRRPGKVQVRYNYALALRAAERYEDALGELEAAVKIDPNDAELRFVSGVVALRLGRASEAETHFQEALRIDPGHRDARHNLALLESVKGRSEGAFTLTK
jgi:Flp pilus assembly protein TadD/TolB-like protein